MFNCLVLSNLRLIYRTFNFCESKFSIRVNFGFNFSFKSGLINWFYYVFYILQKCQICGRSAKDGAILHIDHIIPISKGGRTEIDNLRTLCQSCNLGKGSRVLKPADVVKTDSLSKLKAMLENIE